MGIKLKLPKSVLNFEIGGKYENIDIEDNGTDIFYVLEDEHNTVILSETYKHSLVYEKFERRDKPPHVQILDHNGHIAGFS